MTARSISRRALVGAALAAGSVAAMAQTGSAAAQSATAQEAPLRGSASPARWRTGPPMALERQELYPEVVGDRIYVAGGLLNPNTGLSAHFDAYDTVGGSWQQLATLPDARHHIALAEVGGRIYGVGGFTGGFPRWQARDETFVYDIATDSWERGAALSRPRAEAVVESVGGLVFAIGGRVRATPSATTFNDHRDSHLNEVLDPGTRRWSTRRPAPTARNSAGSAVIDGLIYVVGGRTFSLTAAGQPIVQNLATLEVYDPAGDRWQTRRPMPQPRGGIAATAHDGQLYVFGGEQMNPETRVFDDVYRYLPARDTWDRVTSVPTPRHGLGAATVGDEIHTFGGGTRAGGNFAVATHEIYRPTRA